MGFFKRRGVPEWALFFGDAQWREFERVVRAEITPRRLSGDIRDGTLTDGEARFGLANLAKMCHGEPVETWPELVEHHFALTDETPRGLAGTPKVQLVPARLLAAFDGERVTRSVADDLGLVLSWDQPDHVVSPRRDLVLEHGDPDALFAEAIENTRAEPDLQCERHELPAGEETVELLSLTGTSFFTAAHGLWADELDPPASEYGTLVAVPNRHTVLAHPIRDLSFVGVLGHMLDLARRMEQECPGSISPHLYWLREGGLERLDARIDDAGVQFSPGAEFTAMLETLAAAG